CLGEQDVCVSGAPPGHDSNRALQRVEPGRIRHSGASARGSRIRNVRQHARSGKDCAMGFEVLVLDRPRRDSMFKLAVGILITLRAAWAQGQVSYADAIVPQMPVGCGWTATIILVNLTSHGINFTVNFWPDAGKSDVNAQPTPRVIPI